MTKTEEIKFVVGRNIRRLRESSEETLTDLCASIGMSRAFWGKIEKGEQEPSISTLERIASALNVTVHDLLSESGNGHKKREPVPKK